MLISIVSGTYNRFDILKRMMNSVRRQMYRGMGYEFVIVDGGSTDGTLEWLREQPDVLLIEHGELRGAIPAFCEGARAAGGDYVLMANDDITFHDNSILAAIAHLDDTPTCGAVAFADDRYEKGNHRVMGHSTRDKNGNRITTPYAQVGLFRRWLGEEAGWWGDQDDYMSQARTYGGDNFLSSRIWEMGYTIDPVSVCKIDDAITRDGMRQLNNASGENDSRLYYTRYPEGPLFGGIPPQTPHPYEQRLRILYLPIYEDLHKAQRAQKRGLRDALGKLGIVLEYDYVSRARHNINVNRELIAINQTFRPAVIFTQFHGIDEIKRETIARMRLDNPAALVLNWNGDYWPEVYLQPAMLDMLRWYDLALCVNNHMVAEYEARGIPACYWQIGSEDPQDFPDMPSHDVLFLANAYGAERQRFGPVVKGLEQELGINVGIYGSGWGNLGSGQTLYDFATSHALMRNAKIVIGDNQHNDGSAFVSNRFFETLHCGAFLLHQEIANFDELTGYVAGKHYAVYRDDNDLKTQVRYYLEYEAERQKIAKAGKWYTRRWQSFDVRVKQLFTQIIPEKVRERDYA
jgi:glycosyltransferase involved in cell wall biosynthesis